METWTCRGFTGHWPIGTAAVVYAETREQAAELRNNELNTCGLPGNVVPENMIKFPPDTQHPAVLVLCDGNY